MSTPPIIPPAAPEPSGIKRSGLSAGKLAIAGIAAAVVLIAGAAIYLQQSSHPREAREDARDQALYQDYAAGKLPASAYQTTTTRTDANGNVSTTTEAPAMDHEAAQTDGAFSSTQAATAGMQRVSLADPALRMQDAMTLQLPVGWHFQGGIVRNIPCSPGDPFPTLLASSPDGAYSMHLLTPFFTVSTPNVSYDLHSCGMIAPPSSAANILERYILPAIAPGVQASAPEPVPGSDGFTHAGGTANGMVYSGDAARVHLSLTENGQPMEEYVVALTTTMRMQNSNISTTSTSVEIYKAPAGKLDSFVQQSSNTMAISANPEWQQRSAQMSRQQAAAAQAQGEQQRAAIQQNGQDAGAAGRAMLARTRNQIQQTGQRSMDNAAASEAARHTGAVSTADYVGDRPTSTYFFCNAQGQTRTNNNPNPPGPGWYPCN